MFQRKSVDGVLVQFKKLIQDLNAVNEQCNRSIDDAEIAIKEATDKKAMAQIEKARASRVGSKLTEMLS